MLLERKHAHTFVLFQVFLLSLLMNQCNLLHPLSFICPLILDKLLIQLDFVILC